MIHVVKPYLPSRETLDAYIDEIYAGAWLTNEGPLVQRLTRRLELYLGVQNLLLVGNGTLALQIAYRALGLRGEVITTPFSFVATTSSLVWEGLTPVFADVDPRTFCLDPNRVAQAITANTGGIAATHVFGNACDVDALAEIAGRYDLKLVYDAAHAFAVQNGNGSLLRFGDAATLSFHATKVFHTIEGGAIVFRDPAAYERAKLLINFGIEKPEVISGLGINAKMTEFQAAMGLCVLDEMETLLASRRRIWERYAEALEDVVTLQTRHPRCSNNYSYFPLLCRDEETLLRVVGALQERGIQPRRYFAPSLDTLPYLQPQPVQTVSRDLASRVLCLPIYPGLDEATVDVVIDQVRRSHRISTAMKVAA
jgi:dTDP-4-amino-4,6-dideoxygalactose transaminase